MSKFKTARSAGKIRCHLCGYVNNSQSNCHQCGTEIHSRMPNSLQRTIALLIASIIFYIPANTYPIMVNTMLGNTEPSTIIGGIVEFLGDGSYLVAMIIFTASIVVPVAKIFIIFWLCYATRRQSKMGNREFTVLYNVTEYIGKWSMIDVFVVAILVALVHMSNLVFVEPGIAARAFAMVVVLTMLAAHQFDLRLLWDKQGSQQ